MDSALQLRGTLPHMDNRSRSSREPSNELYHMVRGGCLMCVGRRSVADGGGMELRGCGGRRAAAIPMGECDARFDARGVRLHSRWVSISKLLTHGHPEGRIDAGGGWEVWAS